MANGAGLRRVPATTWLRLARLVEGYARRPQVQERMTRQIADLRAFERGLHLVESQDRIGLLLAVDGNHAPAVKIDDFDAAIGVIAPQAIPLDVNRGLAGLRRLASVTHR